ncbi:cupin domain-containing protein [Sulfurospirillum sp.]|uniref:cupin domain-containing protein n=1 Tax=Sulfurospirillum sp. TaxID=2053622 RepID=UPI002FDEBB90
MKRSLNDIPSSPLQAGEGASMQMLIAPSIENNFAMRKFVIKKDGHMPFHTNTVEHEQYVLKGKARVHLGDESFIALKDDIIFIPAGVAHSYHVIGDEDYEFLCLVPNKEDTIEMVTSGGQSCGC